jgi:hypothetical protein
MYIVAIAWLFVTILMALTESSVTAGLLTFLLYGLAPLLLFWWIVGTPRRRARRALDAHSGAADTGPRPAPSDDQHSGDG